MTIKIDSSVNLEDGKFDVRANYDSAAEYSAARSAIKRHVVEDLKIQPNNLMMGEDSAGKNLRTGKMFTRWTGIIIS